MVTYIGTYTSEITLSGNSGVLFGMSAAIDAYGLAGLYMINLSNTKATETFSAAVFGPAGTDFIVTNDGLIETHGRDTSNLLDAGIVLFSASTVINSGTLLGATGLAMGGASHSSGALVTNSNLIDGSVGIGIALFTDGTVLNYGSIFGANIGVFFDTTSSSYFSNANTATVSTSGNYAVELQGGGNVLNDGVLAGSRGGVQLGAGTDATTLTNSGDIFNTGSRVVGFSASTAVDITEASTGSFGASISNSVMGRIAGEYGIQINSLGDESTPGSAANYISNAGLISGSWGSGVSDIAGALTLVNSGKILSAIHAVPVSTNYAGIYAYSGSATVVNSLAGSITGDCGVKLETGLVRNAGIISGEPVPTNSLFNYAAIYMEVGGTVVNSLSGHISGAFGIRFEGNNAGGYVRNDGFINAASGVGIDFKDGGTVVDSGTIVATGGNAVDFGTGPGLLELMAGGALSGGVTAKGTANSRIDLLSSSSAASFDMGGTVTGFQNIEFDPGGYWNLEGSIAELTGGSINIGDFSAGDTIVLDGFTAVADTLISIAAADYVLDLSNGTSSVQMNFEGKVYDADAYSFSAVANGTEIHLCYLRGTKILTPTGERPVEELRPGDEVVTRISGTQKLKWIGEQKYAGRFLARDTALLPVRIFAGALGEGIPVRDLLISPGHSVLLGEILVLARDLVNGITVLRSQVPDLVEYFALELDVHDCLIADGAFAESFADGPGLRRQFHNVAEFYARFPGYVEPEQLNLCAFRAESGPELEAALRPVVARAATSTRPGALRGYVDIIAPGGRIEGWAYDEANPELPVLLEIRAAGVVVGDVLAHRYRPDLATAGIGNGRAMFGFDAPVMQAITVHRAIDGAELPLSHECCKCRAV